MDKYPFSYIPVCDPGDSFILDNFLPPVNSRILRRWVEKNDATGRLIIDPIGANPNLAIALAQAGCRVLIVRNNPVTWLTTEAGSGKFDSSGIERVVNTLFNSRSRGISLYDQLEPLYETPCGQCGNLIQADGFVWEKDNDTPTARVYTCKFCADSGEREITPEDIENLHSLGRLGIHRSRAFNRVGPAGEYAQVSLNSALDCYMPRALYVCMLLVNRLDNLEMDRDDKQLLRAVLVSIFNDAHSLKHWPLRDYRFLQLSLPNQFYEVNLFKSLTNAIERWRFPQKKIKITYWPHLPEEDGGVCFFNRQLTETKSLTSREEETAVVTIFPRPGQAFWTLSALWAGWLWGKKAVAPMQSALNRRHYDWNWFSMAIEKAMGRVAASVDNKTPIFGILPHFTPSLLYGLMDGMTNSGYRLEGGAYRASDNLFECEWEKSAESREAHRGISLEDYVERYLASYGEPVGFQKLTLLAIRHFFESLGAGEMHDSGEQEFNRLENRVHQLTKNVNLLEPYLSDTSGGSRWWLVNERDALPPISERIELAARDHLLEVERSTMCALDEFLCGLFPEFHTPEKTIINTIIDSYTEREPNDDSSVILRSAEKIKNRENDLKEIRQLLASVASLLGQEANGEEAIVWHEPGRKDASYIFYLTVTSAISDFVYHQPDINGAERVIVFPGSRSALLFHRMRSDPRLSFAVQQGWHFLKFRYLRRLAKKPDLTMEDWRELLDSDPPLWDPPTQLQII